MKKYYDSSKALGVLRNLEAAGIEDAEEMKLEVLLSEAQNLVSKEAFTPSEALREIRVLNAATTPRLADADLTRRIAGETLAKLTSFDRADEAPKTAGSMFQAAENELAMQRGVEPVKLHVPLIDTALQSGFYPGYCCGIVGHEGSLKSSLALHLAEENVWTNPAVRCLFLSLDMTLEMLAFRRVSRFLNVHEATVREMAQAASRDYTEAKEIIERRDDGRLFFEAAPLTLPGLTEKINLTLPSLVVLDYVTLLEIHGETDQFKALKKVVDGIRELKVQTKAVFVILSQMSRASKQAAKGGQVGSHAFGGSVIEHLLDVELELVLDEPEEEGQQKRLITTVTKNRFGPSGISFEVEYTGISKRVTGKAWRLKRDKKPKPAFGSRVGFRDLSDPEPAAKNPKGKGKKKGGNLTGLLPDKMTGNVQGTDEVEKWLKLHPGIKDGLLEEAEKTFDPTVHDSVLSHYESLARQKFREQEEQRLEFNEAVEAGEWVELVTGKILPDPAHPVQTLSGEDGDSR
jgi:RecA/RadA recombinase